MKKIKLTIISIILSITCFAQISKGDIFLGTQFYMNRDITNPYGSEHRVFYLNISPMFEGCIFKNLTVGTYLNLNFHKQTILDRNPSEDWFFDRGVTPFVRYYYNYKHSHVYAHAKYGFIFQGNYLSSKYDTEPNDLFHKPALGLGYMYLFNRLGIFVEINKGWTATFKTPDDGFEPDDLMFEFGIKYRVSKSSEK